MNKVLLIIGIILLVAGGAGAGYFVSIGEGSRIRAFGSEGAAVLGVILTIAGAMMKAGPATAAGGTTSQFKCSQCGASFGSDQAVKSHMKDKHGM